MSTTTFNHAHRLQQRLCYRLALRDRRLLPRRWATSAARAAWRPQPLAAWIALKNRVSREQTTRPSDNRGRVSVFPLPLVAASGASYHRASRSPPSPRS